MTGPKGYGWDAGWEKTWRMEGAPALRPGRVMSVQRESCTVWAEGELLPAVVTGKFRSAAVEKSDFPAVGDWAALEVASGERKALVHSLLTRRTLLARRAPGKGAEAPQVLVANVDTAFIVTTFTEEFSAKRLERYLLMAREGGVEPVVLLNKSDLAAPGDDRLAQAMAAAPETAVLSVSAETGLGMEGISFYLAEGKTAAFLGSSGVGKSTLLNRLLGTAAQSTGPVREDDQRGRHTTTHREIFPVPGGGLVVDTPGLREVGVWADEAGMALAYSDIALWAAACRYADCTHMVEPACGVLKAVEDGSLPRERYDNYLKLRREAAYLKRKQDPVEAANVKKRWKSIHKGLRERVKKKRS